VWYGNLCYKQWQVWQWYDFLLQAINGAAGERSTLFVEYYKKTFDKRNADDDSLKNQRDHLAVRK